MVNEIHGFTNFSFTILEITAIVILLLAASQALCWLHGATTFYLGFDQHRKRADSAFRKQLLRVRAVSRRTPPRNAWQGERRFRVTRKVFETDAMCCLHLAPEDGQALAPFLPGQHLFLSRAAHCGAKRLLRCYALAHSPFETAYYKIMVKRVAPPYNAISTPADNMSRYVHDELQQGDSVAVKAPAGHFYLDPEVDDETPLVLIGIDTGITAVLSILAMVCAGNPQREVWFFYAIRNSREQIMPAYFRKIDERHNNIQVRICYSEPLASDELIADYHIGEALSAALLQRLLAVADFDYYVAGYTSAVNEIVEGLQDIGVPHYAIRSERYKIKRSRVSQQALGRKPPEEASTQMPFARNKEPARSLPMVCFSASNESLRWEPTALSLLEFAEKHNINMPSDCRMGSCHTCMTRVLEGDVECVQPPFNEPDEGCCLPCISIPKSNLVLEI